jgi:hypothetical protein
VTGLAGIAQQGLVAQLTARLPEMLEDLGELVRCESPSATSPILPSLTPEP